MAVLGVDACKDGWVGVRLGDGRPVGFCAPAIAELVAQAGEVEVVGIDIPIGLPVDGLRAADGLARRVVGRRASSVFTPPPRAVLEQLDHAAASALCREMTGQGVSRQSHALGPKVLDVDRWVATGADGHHVVEVHPEVSFATLAGEPLAEPKSTWAGHRLRRGLLAGAGIDVDHLDLPGFRIGVDDVLDAAVVAWSAARVASGEAVSYPHPPEVLDGYPCAIWA